MINQQIDEQQLIQLLVGVHKGKQHAMENLYRTVGPLLGRFAFGIVHNESLSEEVLQESFIQILHHANSFDPKRGGPLTWMRAIVRNKSIDRLRAESKHTRHLYIENDYALDELESAPAYQPDVALSQAQTSKFINTQFEHLPANQRISIRLTYLHGYSRLELAESMNSNMNTIKSWLRRGLKTMNNQNIKARVAS